MGFLIPISMFGWIPFCLALFAMLPPRRACITVFVLGWLFLPWVSYLIPGFPDYSKISVVGMGAFMGALLFDTDRVLAYRPKWIDIPIMLTCVAPFISSMTNGLGWYDGVSASVGRFIMFGISYFVGRIYFTDLPSLRELAVGVVIGGLIYVPLCLYEIRMSPKINLHAYGFISSPMIRPTTFGFRPHVFLNNGLNCGIFMATTTAIAYWLWISKTVRHIFSIPMWLCFAALYATTMLSQVMGPIMLLHGAMAALWTGKRFGMRLPLILMIAAAPLYIGLRSTGTWSGQDLVDTVRQMSVQRSDSLKFRLYNENLLVAKAIEQQWFGWGGWNRSRVFDDRGNDISVTDGLWIILLGQNGLFGMGTFLAALVLPSLVLAWRVPARAWSHPAVAPLLAISSVTVLYMIDSLFNASFNPLAAFLLGGAASGAVALSRIIATAPRPVVPVVQPNRSFNARPHPAH